MLRYQLVEVDRAAEQVDVPLTKRDARAAVRDARRRAAELAKPRSVVGVERAARGEVLAVRVRLVGDQVDELVEHKVDLGLDLVVEHLRSIC
jgi:hypothetical protein